MSVDDACIPIDMTLSVIRSTIISSTDFSTSLCSSDMHTHDQITRVGKQTMR
jgi:hypothetical protein